MSMKRIAHTAQLAGVCLLLLSVLTVAQASQHGLVIGIDDYRYGSDTVKANRVVNLKGAENDARVIAESLRAIGVDLPDARVLLGPDATLAGFRRAWADLMSRSSPGDTLIVSYAGHGGQEKESQPPIDEADIDGYDETLMFYDFNPHNPAEGRLLDDQLYTLLKEAGDRQILFVADACHSGGLTRSLDISAGQSRQGGAWELTVTSESLNELEAEGEDWEALSHVTYLTATDDESRVVREVSVDGVPHGALSVSFAEGIRGRADTNGDDIVLRRELQEYVQMRVQALANQGQSPGFAPRSSSQANLSLLSLAEAMPLESTATQYDDPLAVHVTGINLPEQLQGVRRDDAAALSFRYEEGEVVVYHLSDEVTRWSQSLTADGERFVKRWQRVVDKYRLLRAVDQAYDIRQPALSLRILCKEGGKTVDCSQRKHRVGDVVSFEFDQLRSGNGRYFVLFNLAGNGTLQHQYPVLAEDTPVLASLPFEIAGVSVGDPVGRDDLISLFCHRDPVQLKQMLIDHDGGSAPDPVTLTQQIREPDCQVNRLAVFTAY